MIEFIIEWLVFYIAIMFTMCVDNICWISSSPEFPLFLKYNLKKKIKYIIGYRIYTVLTDIRDIFPALLTSLILTLVF